MPNDEGGRAYSLSSATLPRGFLSRLSWTTKGRVPRRLVCREFTKGALYFLKRAACLILDGRNELEHIRF